MKNELQQHKKSDSIKWIIVFALIAILVIAMVGFVVKAADILPADTTNNDVVSEEGIVSNTNNLDMEYLDLSDIAICLSESGEDIHKINQSGVINAPDMDINLGSLKDFFNKDIFANEYFYANSIYSYDNLRFVFEKNGEYRVHDVCLDSIYYIASHEINYVGEDGTEYKDVYRMLKINYFFDESGDGNNDVRYDTIMLVSLQDTNNPEYEGEIGNYSWNIYSELSKYTASSGYEFVGMYFTDDVSFINCFIFNSAKGE